MKPTPEEFNEAPDPIAWSGWVHASIKEWEEQLTDEFGKFQTVDLPNTCRVVLIPEGAKSSDEWMVCYPSVYEGQPRLLVDDYVPEVAEEE